MTTKVYEADLEKDFSEDPRNANKGTVRGRGMLAKSLGEVGAARSIVSDADGFIAAGNKTREALIEAGMRKAIVVETDGQTPVIVKRMDWALNRQDKKNPARRYAYLDNRVAEVDLAWDSDVLQQDREMVADLFTDDEMSALIAANEAENAEPENEEITDDAPDANEALREKWNVETGQVWVLGNHRIVCGDCTDPDVIKLVMQGELADLVLTDPPYNLAGEAVMVASDVSKSMGKLAESSWDVDFDPKDSLAAIPYAQNCSVYVFTSGFLFGSIFQWLKDHDWWTSWCVWHKPNPMPSLMKRHWTHSGELCVHATRGKQIFNFPEEGHAPNIWSINKASDGTHPTQKAIELIKHIMAHSSNPGQIVFDGFSGSGTTLMSAEALGRKARVIEMDPKYVAVTLERWSKATGKTPALEEYEGA